MWSPMRLKTNLVNVHHVGKCCADGLELLLQLAILEDCLAGFDGGRLTFNVGEDGSDLWNVLADIGFERGDAIMRGDQHHVLV